MLSDSELDALREIERRLRWSDPELVQLFDGEKSHTPKGRRKRGWAPAFAAAAAAAGLTLRGPRLLNDAEVDAQKTAPPARTSPRDSTGARRACPVPSAEAAVTAVPAGVDILIDVSRGGRSPTPSVDAAPNGAAATLRPARVPDGASDRALDAPLATTIRRANQ